MQRCNPIVNPIINTVRKWNYMGLERCVGRFLGRYLMARSLLMPILLQDRASPLTRFILDSNMATFPMKLGI